MSRVRIAAACCLLAVPAVLAFRAGGYFPEPRLIAGIVVWVLAVGAVLTLDTPLSPSRGGWLALGGLFMLTAITGISIEWAPFATVAWNDFGRLVAYLGVFIAGLALLRGRFGLRAVEVAIFVTAGLASCYALSGRLLPGVVHQSVSISAGGRIDQPLTYWNAVGALAAVGFVVAVRLAGDRSRARWASVVAGGLTVPLAMTTYLTFSRGALLAAFVGLFVLLLVTRSRDMALIAATLFGISAATCVVAALLPGVRALEGTLTAREGQGAWMAAAVVVAVACAAMAADRLRSRPARGEFRLRSGLAAAGAVLVTVAFVVAAAGGGKSGGQPAVGAKSQRLASVESNRYAYWKVAGRMFIAHPVAGEGSGAFRVVWRRERSEDDRALDAHSLYFETPAELGLLGFGALITLVAGVAVSAIGALRADAVAAAGPAAALAAMAVHAGMDWDWEFPTLAGLLLLAAASLVGARAQESGDGIADAGRPSAG